MITNKYIKKETFKLSTEIQLKETKMFYMFKLVTTKYLYASFLTKIKTKTS